MEKEKPTVQEFIGKAEYDAEYGFIFNSDVGKSRPFGFVYKQSKVDMAELCQFIADAINEKIEKCKQIETYMDNCKKFGEIKMVGTPLVKFPEPETKYTVQNIPPIELKNLKNPE